MKAYKIDLSGFTGKVRKALCKELYIHGETLGYIGRVTKEELSSDAIAITFDSDARIRYHSAMSSYPSDSNQETTADAFLSLTTAKDEPVFKPFDKVLVRDDEVCTTWLASFYSHKKNSKHFVVSGSSWEQCLPYEGNEALLGTTDSPK